jgi:uncharacterized protein (TIGR02271 family)
MNAMKHIFDYTVYDSKGSKVGSVENLWTDHDHDVGFIGVRTGWLGLGDNHLLPAEGITVNEHDRSVRVPYDEDLIKRSPTFESSRDLSDTVERDVHAHYGTSGLRHGAGESGALPSASGGTAGHQSPARSGSDSVEMPLAKESLEVEKRQKELGQVRLRKVVRSEIVNKPVELRHEDVVVERVATGGAKPGEDAFHEKVATIPVREEEAVVHKNVESAGAVKAHKEVEMEKKDVRGTVRTEDVKVERSPGAGKARR